MGFTRVREVRNHAASTAVFYGIFATPIGLPPGTRATVPGEPPPAVPWCTSDAEFRSGKSWQVVVGGRSYAIWQADQYGNDWVRVSRDGRYIDGGPPIGGVCAAGPLFDLTRPYRGDRLLLVNDSGLFLLPWELMSFLEDLDARSTAEGYRIDPSATPPRTHTAVPSVPKKSVVMFSFAGVPSDAFDRGESGARFLYRDSGKRYELRLVGGQLAFGPAARGQTSIGSFVSYNERRAGSPISPAPVLDLLAASGGRVFAKETGVDRFYLARLDEMYVHARDGGPEFTLPPNYFKIDPEFHQPDAPRRPWDLLAHMAGDYAGHPAGERFTAFRLALDLNLLGGMVVRFERLKWHLIDMRPPKSLLPDASPDVPGWALAYPHVLWRANPPRPDQDPRPDVPMDSVDFFRVLDLGVGHVHHHEQYECITGGEMQPLRTTRATLYNSSSAGIPHWLHALITCALIPMGAKIFPWDTSKTYTDGYRLFNGPVRDGDGYVDGTCNMYLLVQLKPDAWLSAGDRSTWPNAYGILFSDEQTLFSGRWRLADPDDHKNGGFALMHDLADDLQRPYADKIYYWDPDKYWSPFHEGRIGPRSRLAVAAQVMLVNGEAADGTAELYSCNCSYSTMDRSWRWRRFPAPARYFDGSSLWQPLLSTVTGDETVPDGPDECVFPQTLRLREDMTICVGGRGRDADGKVVVGTWFQRYLPADNQLVPPASELGGGRRRPARPYDHPWRFLPKATFDRADRFSHFGVYDSVDSRTQYYEVAPASSADADTLATYPGPWIDDQGPLLNPNALFIDARKFPWDSLRFTEISPFAQTAPLLAVLDLFGHPAHWAPLPETTRLASLFNPRARLRIERRGSRWIAKHADKRDDDLVSFPGLPKALSLGGNAAGLRAQLTLGAQHWVEQPPNVATAWVWWQSADTVGIAFLLTGDQPFADNVWRVRLAGLLDSGDPINLMEARNDGSLNLLGSRLYGFSRSFAGTDLDRMRDYVSAAGLLRRGTSVWFEDVVGHVAPPQRLVWLQSPTLRLTSTRYAMPLGAPVSFSVHAVDAATGQPRGGKVMVDDAEAGNVDAPIPWTFNLREVSSIDTPTGGTKVILAKPVCGVVSPGYAPAPLPFTFYAANAAFRSQTVPTTMVTGRGYQITIVMYNSGTGTWLGVRDGTPTPFRLGAQNPQDNKTWGTNRVELTGPVPEKQPWPFTFTVTAPSTPGQYHFQWRMLEEMVQWFGALTPDVVVNVQAPTLRTSVSPSPIPAGRNVDIIVTAFDSETGAAVSGTVYIAGYPAKPTGTPITIYVVGSYPGGYVRAAGYPDAPIAWPPLTTYSARFANIASGIGGSQL